MVFYLSILKPIYGNDYIAKSYSRPQKRQIQVFNYFRQNPLKVFSR